MHDRTPDDELANRLLAEDRREQDSSTDSESTRDGYALLQALVKSEQAAEQRVRRVAVGAWRATAALVPLAGVLIFVIRESDNFLRQAARPVLIVVGIFAILAMFLAVLSTVAWLFRSRTASLAVVERRLAALEDLVRGSR